LGSGFVSSYNMAVDRLLYNQMHKLLDKEQVVVELVVLADNMLLDKKQHNLLHIPLDKLVEVVVVVVEQVDNNS